MKISVIVPTYNRPSYLARALASIRAQTYQDYEIIVINDAGEDVQRLCELFGPMTYLVHKKNKGLAAARNTGIKNAKGKLIAYLDDDDMWLPQHLEKLAALKDTTSCGVVYSDSYFWREERKFELPLSCDYSPAEIQSRNLTPICSVVHDKELWDRAGKFNEELKNLEDYDLWLRISKLTDFKHLKEVTALYSKRAGSDQMSMQFLDMRIGLEHVKAINGISIQPQTKALKPVMKEYKKMKGIVVRSFVAIYQGLKFRGELGQMIDIVDPGWVSAGLVEPLPSVETETIEPNERAVGPRMRAFKNRRGGGEK